MNLACVMEISSRRLFKADSENEHLRAAFSKVRMSTKDLSPCVTSRMDFRILDSPEAQQAQTNIKTVERSASALSRPAKSGCSSTTAWNKVCDFSMILLVTWNVLETESSLLIAYSKSSIMTLSEFLGIERVTFRISCFRMDSQVFMYLWSMKWAELHCVTLFGTGLRYVDSWSLPSAIKLHNFTMTAWTEGTIPSCSFKIYLTTRLKRWLAQPSKSQKISTQLTYCRKRFFQSA